MADPIPPPLNPFPGLRPFEFRENHLFFGRDTQTDELLKRLRLNRFLAVIGSSGSGKSSLVRAGLLPDLYGGLMVQAGPSWRITVFRPGDDPVHNLAVALSGAEVLGAPQRDAAVQTGILEMTLRRSALGLVEVVRETRMAQKENLLIVVDQFEELFRFRPASGGDVRPEDEPAAFVKLLLNAAQQDQLPIYIVITMRSDYLGDCAQFRDLPETINEGMYLIPRMTRDQRREAITGPVAVGGGQIAPRLVNRLLNDVTENPDQLPILQHALMRTWDFWAANHHAAEPIDLRHYEAIGGMTEALSLQADEAYNELSDERSRLIAEKMFKRLTEKGPDNREVRRPCSVRELCEVTGADEQEVKSVIETFRASGRSFLMPSCDTPLNADSIIDISHESLIRGWDSLRRWVDEEAASAETYRRLAETAELFKVGEAGLWRDPADLQPVLKWRELTQPEKAWGDRYHPNFQEAIEFLEKSKAARDADVAAQRRKQQITAAVACTLALTLIATVWGGYYAFVQEHKAYYREFAKQRGFPVGIGPLSESEARSLPVSFLLVHKGIVRDGWKLHWKPVFRVKAVNGLLELTTNHSVFPYLWKGESESQDAHDKTADEKGGGELGSKDAQDKIPAAYEKGVQLGLKTVCQWEFVSTTKGEIIYEQALDRKGHMVYGLIYSPRGLRSPSTGLTRLVGADGFPQFQRTSAAEYVEIHYDRAGWEDRIMYLDSKDRPAAGPDGAYGQSMQHNGRGQLTRFLSLDKQGDRMKDNAGNCGMDVKYDKNGWDVEERSFGPDLKAMPVTDGYVIVKTQYDQHGRIKGQTFYDVNGAPILSKKDGYHGWEVEYDKYGNQIAITYLGSDAKPTLLADGYATLKSTCDVHGNVTSLRFHGANGEPVLSKENGYHGWEAAYDEQGNQTAVTYLDKGGKPMPGADGYATKRSTYDSRGNVIRLTFHGANNEPVKSKKDGYYGREAAYDEQGNQTVETFLGADGKPASLGDRYARTRFSHDSRRKLTGISYFDVNGEPVVSQKDGYHGLKVEYDEHENLVLLTYLGLDEKPALLADGYATIRSTYDERGNRTEKELQGVKGEPVVSKEDGYHSWEAQYDKRGKQIEITYLGLDEKPVLLPDGYATMRSTYDSRGNVIRLTYHSANGEPAQAKKYGSYGLKAEYDEQGNKTAVTYLDKDGKPMPIADGYATFKSTYDSRGKVIRQTFYGANGEAVQSKKDGYHGWAAEYDEQGNQTVETYLGTDGEPMPSADGYVTRKSTYDARGNVIRLTFHGPNGEPVQSKKDGYYGREAEYDEQGNKIVETYFGLDGKPMLLPDGYASVKSTYDARGKETRRSLHGVNGEPVVDKDGNHGWEAEYDEQGNKTVETYLAKDGKPMPGADGYATVKSTYDSRGNVIRLTYHSANGEPAQAKKYGSYGLKAEYDEQGNKTAVTYLDKDGKPMPIADGYATFKSTYDSRGKVIRQTFYGANGEAVQSKKDGYHGWAAEYDEQGNQTVETYLGKDGKPMLGANGYATTRSTYDSQGNVIRLTFHGANGEPVKSKRLGYYGVEAEYDKQGIRTAVTYLDRGGKRLAGEQR
jgi:energy-coupling factor transporter ATP-binding protein EcfA2